jgi:uncharacterized membrane protein
MFLPSLPTIIPNLHPLFVHFPIALIPLSTALFIGSIVIPYSNWKEKLYTASLLNLWIGTAISTLTIGTGLWAAKHIGHTEVSHTVMETHQYWGIATGLLLLLLTLWSINTFRNHQTLKKTFLIGLIIATGMVTRTGWLGGELVFRHGVGVLSQDASKKQTKTQSSKPKTHIHDTNHSHNNDHPH